MMETAADAAAVARLNCEQARLLSGYDSSYDQKILNFDHNMIKNAARIRQEQVIFCAFICVLPLYKNLIMHEMSFAYYENYMYLFYVAGI